MKERALELAKKLEWYSNYPEFVEAGEMIRRLVEELDNADAYIDNLKKQIQHLYKQGYRQEHCCPDCGCHFVGEYPFNNAPQTKPLSDDEIAQVHKETFSKLATDLDFARAIEERHGIK